MNAPTEPSDFVIWYHTTSHSGNDKRLNFFKNIVLAYDGTKSFNSLLGFRIERFANFLIEKAEKDRVA